jgi:hypothetical protein
MIIGAHSIIYSRDAEADRTFLKEVIGLTHVDVGGGWLIFGLPPSEVAVHPGGEEDGHEFYLMCEDVEGFVRRMKAHRRACGPVQGFDWGLLTHVTLPGGGKLGVYQPRHARPATMSGPAAGGTKKKAQRKKARTISRAKTRTSARANARTSASAPARGVKKTRKSAKTRRR